jgi:hypothetical protein
MIAGRIVAPAILAAGDGKISVEVGDVDALACFRSATTCWLRSP